LILRAFGDGLDRNIVYAVIVGAILFAADFALSLQANLQVLQLIFIS
jgi:hypothetical protein